MGRLSTKWEWSYKKYNDKRTYHMPDHYDDFRWCFESKDETIKDIEKDIKIDKDKHKKFRL